MNGTLPPWAIDLIRDGVPPADLKAKGGRAVWHALVRTAASAQHYDWDRWVWEEEVTSPKSNLGRQVATKDGRRPRTPKAVRKTLQDAWEAAWEWRTTQEAPWSRQEAQEAAEERAKAAVAVAEDPDTDLTDAERAVLVHAAAEVRRYAEKGKATTAVTLPRAPMQEATGLGLTALRTALRRLEDRGLLTLTVRGQRGAPGPKRKANVYALGAPTSFTSMYRGTRSVVPPAQTSSAPQSSPNGAPHQTSSAPTEKETDMRLTLNPTGVITLEATSAEYPLEKVLDALKNAGCLVEVRQAEEPTEDRSQAGPGKVIPLTRRAAQ